MNKFETELSVSNPQNFQIQKNVATINIKTN
jgi:hypothetical protein